VLDLYRRSPDGLTPAALGDALTFAETATVLALDGADSRGPGRPAAMSGDQAVVHQAAGMISVQLGVRVDVAFARLRAHAFATDRRLGEVAQAVVDRRLRFHPDGPRGPAA
jgi:hypothetical protein